MIGSAPRAAEHRPGKLTKEELDDIARFVRFAQRRNGAQEAGLLERRRMAERQWMMRATLLGGNKICRL